MKRQHAPAFGLPEPVAPFGPPVVVDVGPVDVPDPLGLAEGPMVVLPPAAEPLILSDVP